MFNAIDHGRSHTSVYGMSSTMERLLPVIAPVSQLRGDSHRPRLRISGSV